MGDHFQEKEEKNARRSETSEDETLARKINPEKHRLNAAALVRRRILKAKASRKRDICFCYEACDGLRQTVRD